jgi:hypothetical protein
VTTTIRRSANASEKLPEKTANIIKAAALMLDTNDQETEDRLIDNIITRINASNTPSIVANQDLTNQIKMNAIFLKHTVNSQAEMTDKTNTLMNRLEKLCKQTENALCEVQNLPKAPSQSTSPYKVALNSHVNTTPPTWQTLNEHKLLNCINIKACQLLVEFKADAHEKLFKTNQLNAKPINILIKEAINNWLSSPEDKDRPLPKKAHVQVVNLFGNNHLMVEMNTNKAAMWMKNHPDRILGCLLKSLVKILTHTYAVVARFLPIAFDITEANLQALEEDMAFPTGSIKGAHWIKDPSK